MKKIMQLMVVMLLVVSVGGCATMKSWFGFDDSPYQAGRTLVFTDTVTEAYQPPEVAAAIDQIYAIASMNLEATSLVDEVVNAEIDKLMEDSTAEARAMVFTVYKGLFDKLHRQIEINPDLPDIEVLNEFFRGINDALAIYQPKDTT